MAPVMAVVSVVKPTVVPIVIPNALMHQNNAIATAATVRAPTPLRAGFVTLFLHIEKLDNFTSTELATLHFGCAFFTARAETPGRTISHELAATYSAA